MAGMAAALLLLCIAPKLGAAVVIDVACLVIGVAADWVYDGIGDKLSCSVMV
jgi:hypothetical protein